jgi:hypothetical protein
MASGKENIIPRRRNVEVDLADRGWMLIARFFVLMQL